MVAVRVEWLTGRSQEQKRALVAAITEALDRIGAQREDVRVVLHNVPPTSWSRADEFVEHHREEQAEAPAHGGATGHTRMELSDFEEATRVFDLEQPRTADMPVYASHRPGFSYFLHRHHEDGYEPKKTGPRTSAYGVIFCTEHSGTHIDAICHQADGLTLFGG